METVKFYTKFYYNYVVWKLLNFMIEILLQLCSMETVKFLCSMETDKFLCSMETDKFYADKCYCYWRVNLFPINLKHI